MRSGSTIELLGLSLRVWAFRIGIQVRLRSRKDLNPRLLDFREGRKMEVTSRGASLLVDLKT